MFEDSLCPSLNNMGMKSNNSRAAENLSMTL